MARRKPLIGIPADRRILGPHPFHCVGEKYIAAVAEASDAPPGRGGFGATVVVLKRPSRS